jgi:hypothetical protein
MMMAQGAQVFLYSRTGTAIFPPNAQRGDVRLGLNWTNHPESMDGFALSLGDAGAWTWEPDGRTGCEMVEEIDAGRGTEGYPALTDDEARVWRQVGLALLEAMEGGDA